MKQSLASLNDYLFAQLERVTNDDLTGEALNTEIQRSKAVTGLASQIAGVREEFGNSEEALRAACLEETGISIVDYMDTHEVEVSEA